MTTINSSKAAAREVAVERQAAAQQQKGEKEHYSAQWIAEGGREAREVGRP